MAKTFTSEIGTWDTFHNNGPFPTKFLQRTHLEAAGNLPSRLDRYLDAADEIQRLIKDAADAGQGFRAFGSRWSMSAIAHHHDRIHSNVRMNLKLTLSDTDLHPNTVFKSENLFLFQCGNIIKEISEFLFDHGKSLKSSGASNGQTIAGAISTGIHGSAVFAGAVQDYVVGINIITGPEPADIVYLERKSRPALNNAFAAKLNVKPNKIFRDDDLFNAALVGLGAFGFIHGVVVEAEDLYLLKRYTTKIKRDQIVDLLEKFDFKNLKDFFPKEKDDQGESNLPYHFKIFVNPYNNEQDWMVEAMFKKPYHSDYPDPVREVEKFLYRDLIILFSKFVRRFPKSIPKLIEKLQSQALPDPELEVEGTLKEIFWDAPHHGAVFACAVAVDIRDAVKTMQILIDLVKDKPVPGIYAMRFTRGTEATLGFTRFNTSCIIEMDGSQWKGGRKIISPETFYTRIINSLQVANIPFTHHWGKNARWNFPGLIKSMYGEDRITAWKKNRTKLLSPEMGRLFSNNFLDTLGLSEIPGDDEV